MIELLGGLANYPFTHKTYLHWFHTVRGDESRLPAGSSLLHVFLRPPSRECITIDALAIGGHAVNLLWVDMITDAELEYKLANGAEALIEKMDAAGLSCVLDVHRSSVV